MIYVVEQKTIYHLVVIEFTINIKNVQFSSVEERRDEMGSEVKRRVEVKRRKR